MFTGAIIWPSEPQEAIRLYLNFVLQTLERVEFKNKASLKEPMDLAARFVRSEVSVSELNATAQVWWSFLNEGTRIRDFRSNETLIARLALCLVNVNESRVSDLGELVSWFMEVLEYMRVDSKVVTKFFEGFFKFSC